MARKRNYSNLFFGGKMRWAYFTIVTWIDNVTGNNINRISRHFFSYAVFVFSSGHIVNARVHYKKYS